MTKEEVKPETILAKHWLNRTGKPIDDMTLSHLDYAISAMREYSQIACSTLSEDIRVKDERIEKAENILKHIYDNFTYIVNDPDGMNECIEMLENYQLNP